MYKYISLKLPVSFLNMFRVFPEPNRTRNFILEQTKQKSLDIFPKVALQRVWNNFSIDLKTAASLNCFKNMYKNVRFSAYKSFKCQNANCYSCLN